MGRNSSGVYSLPSGNPVTNGDNLTDSLWNDTFGDIAAALTGSLPRDGSAPMTNPLKLPDGSASAPSLTFNSDTNTGLYRISADVIGVAVNGVKVGEFNSNGFTPSTAILLPNGSAANPSLRFSGDTDMGLYLEEAGKIGISVAGTKVGEFNSRGYLGGVGARLIARVGNATKANVEALLPVNSVFGFKTPEILLNQWGTEFPIAAHTVVIPVNGKYLVEIYSSVDSVTGSNSSTVNVGTSLRHSRSGSSTYLDLGAVNRDSVRSADTPTSDPTSINSTLKGVFDFLVGDQLLLTSVISASANVTGYSLDYILTLEQIA